MSPPKAEILSNIFIAFEKLLKRRTIEWPENRHIYCSDSIRIKQKEKCRLNRLKTLQKWPKNVNCPATSRKVITQYIERGTHTLSICPWNHSFGYTLRDHLRHDIWRWKRIWYRAAREINLSNYITTLSAYM